LNYVISLHACYITAQEESEQNEVDGTKKGAASTDEVMHMWKSGWWFVMRKIRMVEPVDRLNWCV